MAAAALVAAGFTYAGWSAWGVGAGTKLGPVHLAQNAGSASQEPLSCP